MSGDRLLGECSINLVEVVSGRVPHIEEWVPLNTEGDLRLSLDYDSVGRLPMPGDSVRVRFFFYLPCGGYETYICICLFLLIISRVLFLCRGAMCPYTD